MSYWLPGFSSIQLDKFQVIKAAFKLSFILKKSLISKGAKYQKPKCLVQQLNPKFNDLNPNGLKPKKITGNVSSAVKRDMAISKANKKKRKEEQKGNPQNKIPKGYRNPKPLNNFLG